MKSLLIFAVRADLSPNDRLKFKTIATIDVHARDIIEGFVRDSILDAQEFGWESQLRYDLPSNLLSGHHPHCNSHSIHRTGIDNLPEIGSNLISSLDYSIRMQNSVQFPI